MTAFPINKKNLQIKIEKANDDGKNKITKLINPPIQENLNENSSIIKLNYVSPFDETPCKFLSSNNIVENKNHFMFKEEKKTNNCPLINTTVREMYGRLMRTTDVT